MDNVNKYSFIKQKGNLVFFYNIYFGYLFDDLKFRYIILYQYFLPTGKLRSRCYSEETFFLFPPRLCIFVKSQLNEKNVCGLVINSRYVHLYIKIRLLIVLLYPRQIMHMSGHPWKLMKSFVTIVAICYKLTNE